MNNHINGNAYLIPVLIDDTIQTLKFFPSRDINYLASAGWDGKLSLFEIKYEIINQNLDNENAKINANQINICQHSSPILSVSWKGNSGSIISGCVDGSINYIDFQKNILYKIGQHKSGCKEVLYNENCNILMTGGWDGLLKIWDLREQNPVSSYQFNNKIYSISYSNNLLVVGLSEQVMSYFNLQKMQKSIFEPELIFSSGQNIQTKKIVVFNDASGYVQALVQRRISIKYLNLNSNPKVNADTNEIFSDKDFSFRCHSELKNGINNFYHINDISLNPVYGSLCTVGGDGFYRIWDIEKRSMLSEKSCNENNDIIPLTACQYNKSGHLLAYAQGYDWSKGATFASKYPRPKIFLHYVKKSERKKIP